MNNLNLIKEKRVARTIEALKKNNMEGIFIKEKKDLFNYLENLIPENSLIGFGGSQTLIELGVLEFLKNEKYNLLDRYEKGLSPEDIKDIFRKSFFSDFYFSSVNGITEDGCLYNVDSTGNRVAAMIYGPENVVIISGINKIVKSIPDAIRRNEELCGPANATRLSRKTPCVVTGYCTDCKSEDRICSSFTIMKYQKIKNRIKVLLVDDSLGY